MNGWPEYRNDEVQGHWIVREGVRGWRDRGENMDGWTRRSWETAVLWELKLDGAASQRGTNIRVLQPGTWEARTRSGTRGVTNNGVHTV